MWTRCSWDLQDRGNLQHTHKSNILETFGEILTFLADSFPGPIHQPTPLPPRPPHPLFSRLSGFISRVQVIALDLQLALGLSIPEHHMQAACTTEEKTCCFHQISHARGRTPWGVSCHFCWNVALFLLSLAWTMCVCKLQLCDMCVVGVGGRRGRASGWGPFLFHSSISWD